MASPFSNQSYFFILSIFSKINQSFFENLPILPYRCSKINPSFFTIKEGSTSHLGLLPSGKKRKPLLSIVFTTPSVPLVGDRNVALNRFAIRLAGHQSPRQGCFSGDEPAGRRLAKMVVRDGTVGGDLLKPMVIRDGTAGTR